MKNSSDRPRQMTSLPIDQNPAVSSRLQNLKVLIAEGAPRLRKHLEGWVRATGSTKVMAVGTLTQCLRLLTLEPWDVVLLDCELPDGNGFDSRVFSTAESPACTGVVAMCTSYDLAMLLRVQAAGAVLLLKSDGLSCNTLRVAIEIALGRRSERPLASGSSHTGDRSLQPGLDRLNDGMRPIHLSAPEKQILTDLGDSIDTWVSAAKLAKRTLNRNDFSAEILVRQYVFRLRKKIHLSGWSIEHARSRGYRLVRVCSRSQVEY